MLYSSTNIPYQEYRAISQLMEAHPSMLNGNLRALIAFGEIVATGESQNIYLLEVVTDWQGPRSVSYGSTEALPLRGRLNLYFLTPDEFEHPTAVVPADQTVSSLELLRQVRQAYAILLENPYDYAQQVMSRQGDLTVLEPAGAEPANSDPVSFLRQQTLARTLV